MADLDSTALMAIADRNGGAAAAPPQNLEAEQSVLGAVLLSDTALPALIIDERLQPEDFYREAHGLIFQAMLDLHTVGEPVDALTLVEHLKQSGLLDRVGGRAAVDLLAGSVPAVGNVRQYARIVRENAMLRRLLHASYEIQARVHSHEASPRELVDLAERSILEVAHEDRRKDFRAIHDLLSSELDKLEQLSAEGLSVTGTPSGFEDLDRITGGFQAGNLIILAARPGMGKCLAGSSLVYDPATGGRRASTRSWRRRAGRDGRGRGGRAGPQAPSRARERGAAQRRPGVYRLTTRLGRDWTRPPTIPCSRSRGGGGCANSAPERGSRSRASCLARLRRTSMPDHEVVLLAALIADGNLTERTPRFCSARVGDPSCGRKAAGELGLTVHDGGGGTATISAGRGGPPNPLTEILRGHGLWGLRSGEKFVPDAVFAPRRRADRPLPLGALRLRRPRLLVRALLADRLHDDQRAARARRPAPPAAARHRRRD